MKISKQKNSFYQSKMKTNYYILLLFFIALNISCSKKETLLPEAGSFARVQFSDPFSVFTGPNGVDFRVNYQGKPLIIKSMNAPITVLEGEGKFEFFHNDTKVLESNLVVTKDKVKNYVFFKPDAISTILLENNQSTEPKPAEDFIKIKIANLAQSIPAYDNKNIKIVFSQYDENFEPIPADTISTVGSEFTNGYVTIARRFNIRRGNKVPDPLYLLTFLDENDLPLPDFYADWIADSSKSIFTLFIEAIDEQTVAATPIFEH